MPKYNLTWQEADVQLLEALLLASGEEGGAPLHEILLMADAVDGTVLSQNEVEQGLEKLMSVGYVAIKKNKLLLTPTFLTDYESIDGAEDERLALEQLLQTKALQAENFDEPKILIKKYKLKNQYQAYLEQFGG
ncbi:hypothetical protein [Pontibacter flavimaris]|uniref:Uncharacterized protein n=1 Tax=Pontibacter flavimaris TaxID=1797110 RepID=A0A1Q5PAC7_9BACT|nr:hypothetical protein [Pontibacter flavimaris]OKL39210.1 hypothetical protein A3841_04515 [Pontibacter flavimaris]